MKNVTLFLALATCGLAQVGPPPTPRPNAEALKVVRSENGSARLPGVGITRQILRPSEDLFNLKLTTFNEADPVYILGATRGVYLTGFGAVFTVELDLVHSPTINPFQKEIPKEQADAIYARKQKQLPLIKKAMMDQLAECAKSLEAVPANEQVVMVIRLDYQPAWEKITGLPAQIMLHADRRSAAAGQIQEEDQF